MSKLTMQQEAWLAVHPDYEPVGPPRPDVQFRACGTLYPTGYFEKLEPMKAVKLVAGPPYAICVGVRS